MSEKTKKILLIPGDGIGQEVIPQGERLLQKIAAWSGVPLSTATKDYGAERYLRTGVGLPLGDLAEIKDGYHAILFGALGDPRIPDMAHGREILLGLRFGLDLYANIRPVRLWSDSLGILKGKNCSDIDFVVVRENTEDIYLGAGGVFKKDTPDEIAVDESIHTRKGVERVVRYAFAEAVASKRSKVTLVDKSNAIRFGGDLWQRTFQFVKRDFPGIETEHLFVDLAALEMVRNPKRFQVIVTSNLFGDILTDLGAGIAGGLGLAASANIHPGAIGLFEPVHGSAPDIAHKNKANPFAAFLSVAMMLRFLQMPRWADLIEKAIVSSLQENKVTADLGGTLSTTEASDAFLTTIEAIAHETSSG